MLKIPLLVSLGHHGGRRKVASLRPPFSTPLRSLGEPDPETPFLVPIEHAPPLFVRIREDKISLKISPAPLTNSPSSHIEEARPTNPESYAPAQLGLEWHRIAEPEGSPRELCRKGRRAPRKCLKPPKPQRKETTAFESPNNHRRLIQL